jgi:hypothetical protein
MYEYPGEGNLEETGSCRRILLSSAFRKIFSEILTGRLEDWQLNHTVSSIFYKEFVKGRIHGEAE